MNNTGFERGGMPVSRSLHSVCRSVCLGVAVAAVALCPRVAQSQEQEILPPEPKLADPEPWSSVIDGFVGLGLNMTTEADESHGIVGGAARLRIGYFELGALAEYADFGADSGDNHATQVAGLVGAFLPFNYWADIEAALGVGRRSYVNTNSIFGGGGYKKDPATLDLRLGVSDRMGTVLGGRLGAQLFISYDLDRWDVPFRIEPEREGEAVRTGTRRVGGLSIGMLMTVGFDVGPYTVRPQPVRPVVAPPINDDY
ncbi:MAG: hypothetical protein JW940_25745 [Polyangiaceae bacterium]|nr:hypothetical protein [Polyangiaceae bacterium]